jgi:hypothetical protein
MPFHRAEGLGLGRANNLFEVRFSFSNSLFQIELVPTATAGAFLAATFSTGSCLPKGHSNQPDIQSALNFDLPRIEHDTTF